MKLIRTIAAAGLMALAGAAATAAPSFAEWSESFAADWVRQSAEWATEIGRAHV